MEAVLTKFIQRLKASGLDEAEDVLRLLVKEGMQLAREAAPVVQNPALKFALPFVAMIEAPLLRLIDKVDGKEG